ncbi:RNA polymerase sigma factor [Steroidobacter sp.]|uniref:RNA polymerase sigma factor n=1 Tax=Steroidobacter sp. TaxID=1978227 RepID=UPI001A60A136|nr:RNA polymerase sigma factor [Steroidobacter sp.]MBL8266573.1 RNA polymerase sigma factor [Steroidobacter sp.]
MIPLQRAADLAAALFKARGEDLLGFLRRRLRSDADARDIAQETYLRFIRLADPRRIDNAEAYLFRIAANLLYEHRMRQRTTLTGADEMLSAQLMTEQTPLDLAVSAEVARRLRSVVEDLPSTQRAIVILHIRDGLTYGDIAGRIGVSESMVKKHAYTAFAFCRKRLRDLKLEHTEAP